MIGQQVALELPSLAGLERACEEILYGKIPLCLFGMEEKLMGYRDLLF